MGLLGAMAAGGAKAYAATENARVEQANKLEMKLFDAEISDEYAARVAERNTVMRREENAISAQNTLNRDQAKFAQDQELNDQKHGLNVDRDERSRQHNLQRDSINNASAEDRSQMSANASMYSADQRVAASRIRADGSGSRSGAGAADTSGEITPADNRALSALDRENKAYRDEAASLDRAVRSGDKAAIEKQNELKRKIDDNKNSAEGIMGKIRAPGEAPVKQAAPKKPLNLDSLIEIIH